MGEKISPEEYAKLEGLPGIEGKKFLTPFMETMEDVETLADNTLPERLRGATKRPQAEEKVGGDYTELAEKYVVVRNQYEEIFARVCDNNVEQILIYREQRKDLISSMNNCAKLLDAGKITNNEYYRIAEVFISQLEIMTSILKREVAE
jgi:hypothetical protein